MLLEKEKVVFSSRKKHVQKGKKLSLVLFGFCLALCSVAYFVFSTQTENKTERLSALKEKCYLQIALTEDEKSELCDLLFELENLPKENCENIENLLFQQNLDEFFSKNENCIQAVHAFIQSKGFETHIETALNRKGKVIYAKKNGENLFNVRFMHKSSGHKNTRLGLDYFVLHYEFHHSYIDSEGKKTNKPENWHIRLDSCKKIQNIIQRFNVNYIQK